MSAEYRCTNCGSERVAVDASRPSLDDRYAIGRCQAEDERYAASKKAKTGEGKPPKHATLVRADLYEAVRSKREADAAIKRRASAAKAATTPGSTRVSLERMAEGRRVVEDLYE